MGPNLGIDDLDRHRPLELRSPRLGWTASRSARPWRGGGGRPNAVRRRRAGFAAAGAKSASAPRWTPAGNGAGLTGQVLGIERVPVVRTRQSHLTTAHHQGHRGDLRYLAQGADPHLRPDHPRQGQPPRSGGQAALSRTAQINMQAMTAWGLHLRRFWLCRCAADDPRVDQSTLRLGGAGGLPAGAGPRGHSSWSASFNRPRAASLPPMTPAGMDEARGPGAHERVFDVPERTWTMFFNW